MSDLMRRAVADREFVRMTVAEGERHIHRPERRIRFDLSECVCGAVVKEKYGAWGELSRFGYWRWRRYWREPDDE